MSTHLDLLKAEGEAPSWLLDEGFKTLSSGYLLPDETPRQMYRRVARAAASYYARLGTAAFWEERFFDVMWKNWLCPASPVLSNTGTTRGLPISCLTGDTWLNTPTGGIQIKDVTVGTKLLTHEGRYRPVTGVQSRQTVGDLYVMSVGTRTTPLRITGNHPVLTNLGWVRVDELDPRVHYVATNHDIETTERPHVLDMRPYVDHDFAEIDGRMVKLSTNKRANRRPKDGLVSYVAKVHADVPVSTDLAWALGLWCAEGSLTTNPSRVPNGARITMGQDEEPTLTRWLGVMTEAFGVNGKVSFSEATRANFAHGRTTRWANTNVNGKPLGRFFQREFGDNCKDKVLPQWLLDLPKEHLRAFLDGLLDGDGYYKPNGSWSITLANPKLLLGVYNICLKLGIAVSLQMQAKPSSIGKTTHVYILHSIKEDSIKLAKYNVNSGIVFGKLRYCPILRLEKLSYDTEVFDVQVEEDHSFSAAGVVVHNCNSIHVADEVDSIFMKAHELAMLSKHGAGVGIYLGDVRGRGEAIHGNGRSEGIIPWAKVYDSTIVSIAQGATRRGAGAIYLPVEHPDASEFLNMRRPTGDVNRRCLNINHGLTIPDEWMRSMLEGDKAKREVWQEILKTRVETGEPYLFFADNVNGANPDCYKANNLRVSTSNICSEITLHTDPEHSFVCCLSSLNLARWDEWKDSDLPETATYFLDAVLSEYIERGQGIVGLDNSIRSAVKGRAIGIGVLGWHSLLQANGYPFDSLDAMMLNARVFKMIRAGAEKATKELSWHLGEPEWCQGFERRNTHLMAVAPTVSNSLIAGGQSAGVEPLAANIYAQKSGKGTFIRRNPALERVLVEAGMNDEGTWRSIVENDGSVQHLSALPETVRAVFATAREINQHAIVRQAIQRQKWVDQAQSINLFFAGNSDPKYIHEVHVAAWQGGLKTLYYLRSSGVIKGDLASRASTECAACEA
jgi:ribonucleoside-diphosphate reductase alpha chain